MPDVTLDQVVAKLNEMGAQFNTLLDAFDAQSKELAAQKITLAEVLSAQRDAATQHPINLGGADLSSIIADIQELKSRPMGALTPQQHKAAADAALQRESKAHQGDKMMYHSNPAHPKLSIVVRSDAEVKEALVKGYHPTIELAAKATLGEKAADKEAVIARMEELRQAVFKAA